MYSYGWRINSANRITTELGTPYQLWHDKLSLGLETDTH